MGVVCAHKAVGSYRCAAAICGVDPKTVKPVVAMRDAGELDGERMQRASWRSVQTRNAS